MGIMTRLAVNHQHTLNLLYAETGWIKHDYKSPAFINSAWLLTISRQYDDKIPVFIKPAWLLTLSR